MQMNTRRCIEKQDEIQELQKQIIKIDLGIQEIKKEITYVKIKQHNDNEKLEDTISQQSEDTRIMEKVLQQVKSTFNQHNQFFPSNTVKTHDLKLKPSHKGSIPASG